MPLSDFPDLAERFVADREFVGGEGRSWRVRPHGRGPDRLLKVLPAGAGLDEAALLTALRHPAIPTVHEVGRSADGSVFVLRDWIDGHSLADADQPRPDLARLLRIGADLLEVLAYVHLREVLHLDIKPANVLADADGHLHLVDFGFGQRGRRVHASGGTPFFVSPEVLLGSAADPGSDLFSVGALLTALAVPEGAIDLGGFLRRFPRDDFLAAAGLDIERLPEPLRRVVPRLTAREPADRFADAQEALEALRGSGSGRPTVATLAIDPVVVHAAARDAIEAALAEGPVEVRGAAADDRRRLALHAACARGDVEAIRDSADACLVVRSGSSERTPAVVTVEPLDVADLAPHLGALLGLEPDAARRAAERLHAGGARSASSAGAQLRALAEAGALVPDGPRWIWPDALSGRLDDALAVDAPPADAAGIRAAAMRGAVAAAEAGYRRAAAVDPDAEPELRRALADGLLRAGEPGRALPLTHDAPALRARALIELSRPAEAAEQLGRLGQGTADDDVLRMVAMVRHLAGRPLDGLAVTERFRDPGTAENRICRGFLLAAAGRPEAADHELGGVVAALPADRTPHLRAVALSNLGNVARQRGELRRALDLHAEALDLHRRTGHVRNVAMAATNVGVVAKDLGDHERARASLRQARTLFEHVGDATGALLADTNLGAVLLEAGDVDAAAERFDKALPQLAARGLDDARLLVVALRARARARLGDRTGAEADIATLSHTEPSARIAAEIERARADLDAAPRVAETAASTRAMPRATESGDPAGVPRATFRTFLAVNRRLASERDLEHAMRHLLDAAQTVTGAREGYLLVARDDVVRVELASNPDHRGDRAFSRSLANQAISQMRTMTAADALADRSLLDAPSVRNLRVRSAVCVPFRGSSGLAGALYVEHAGRPDAFDGRDVELLEALADQAAIAVDRMAREEELADALTRTERDLAVARRQTRSKSRVTMLGVSPAIEELKSQIERFGQSSLPILVVGETGSGKELVARALHDASPVRGGPFVSENCSAIPAELIESELFGHVQGAFTGADQDRAGLLELSCGGTLFLDEVGDMPADMQVKLLRALQEGQVRRVGGREPIAVEVRLVTATHKDLAEQIATGAFREDLYYRIAAGVVRVPALRDRADDVILLARHFLERLSTEHGREVRLTDAAAERLRAWRWPGNVRELEHVIARAFILADGDTLPLSELPGETGTTPAEDAASWPVMSLEEAIRRTIRAALRETGGDKTAAAKLLGMSRTALYDRLRREPELGE